MRQFAKLTQFTKCDIRQSSVRQFTKLTQFTKCDVHKSPVMSQSQISSDETIYNLKSQISNLKSPLVRESLIFTATLQVYHSPISTVMLLQLHHPVVNIHLLTTILCDYATQRLSDHVIMLPINNLDTDVNALVKYSSAS